MAYRVVSATESTSPEQKLEDDEEKDAVFFRLEALGYRVGQGLVERYIPPLSPQETNLSNKTKQENEKQKLNTNSKSQLLQRQTSVHRYSGRYKIPLQRPLDAGFPQADR